MDEQQQATIEAPEETKAPKRIGLGEVILAFFLYFVVQIVAVGIIVALGYDVADLTRGTGLLLVLVAGIGSGLIAVAVAVAIRTRSFSAVGLRRVTGRWIAIGVGLGLAALLVNRLVILVYFWISGDVTNPQQGLADTATQGSPVQFTALIILGGLLTPLAEELLFRGVLYTWLRRWGVLVSVVVSATVFGLFHGVNVVLPAAILLGVLCALVYEKSGSIWPAVAIHATNNTLIFVLARILTELDIPVG